MKFKADNRIDFLTASKISGYEGDADKFGKARVTLEARILSVSNLVVAIVNIVFFKEENALTLKDLSSYLENFKIVADPNQKFPLQIKSSRSKIRFDLSRKMSHSF